MNINFNLNEYFKEVFRKRRYSKDKMYGKDQTLVLIIYFSVGLSLIFFVFGFLSLVGTPVFPPELATGMDLIVFGLLGCIGPIGFYNHMKMKRKRQIQDRLPDFLRDIANSSASGMTVFDSIRAAAEGEYGPLTEELKMISSQLSWGIPVEEALMNFAKRMNTNEAKRLAITINKALEIGGNTASVFNAAAKEIDQLKRVEIQRKTDMTLYSIVIFISFFVFLAVIIVINSTIFSAIYSLQDQLGGRAIGGMRLAQIDPSAIENMFFMFVLVQSVGGGLLGGFMMDGNLSSGVRHAFSLVLVSFLVFKLLI